MSDQSERDQQLIEKICQALDDGTESFDGQTRSKLAQERNMALQEKARSRRLFPAWQTGAVMATAALLIVMVLKQPNGT